MEEIDYEKLYRAFNRYGARPQVNTRPHDYDINGTTYRYLGRNPVELNIEFVGVEYFNKFILDMIRFEETKDEEYLRHRNPTLLKAYEEYQILLKLTK